MQPRVVITHRVHPEVLDLLGEHAEVIANQSPDTLPRQELLERLAEADAMLAFMPDRVDAQLLDSAPRLRIIGAAVKDYDNFDAGACSARGVWLSCVPDLFSTPTAELAIGLAISLTRRVREADAVVRSGEFTGWTPEFYGLGIADSRIGIVGMGATGRAIATRLKGWGAEVLYTDMQRLPADEERSLDIHWRARDEVLATSDIVMLAMPLTAATRGLINVARLALMKPGAFLVNPCRGSVVDEAAVLGALHSGRLGGYAADVFEMEDRAHSDRPRGIAPALLAHPRTLFTPNIGSSVRKARLAVEQRAAANILQALAGAVPLDAVNEVRARRAI